MNLKMTAKLNINKLKASVVFIDLIKDIRYGLEGCVDINELDNEKFRSRYVTVDKLYMTY